MNHNLSNRLLRTLLFSQITFTAVLFKRMLHLPGKSQSCIKTFSRGLSFSTLVKGLFAQKVAEGRLQAPLEF